MNREFLRKLWNRASYLGLLQDEWHPDRKYIMFSNQVVFIMAITVLILDLGFFALGLFRIGIQLISMLVGFLGIMGLMYKRHFTAARLFGLSIQNFNLLQLSLFIGNEARVVDFFIVMTLLPLVLFNIRHRAAIIFCAVQAFVFYCLFLVLEPHTVAYQVSLSQQFLVYYMTIPVKFVLVLLVVYIMVRNSESEIEAERKKSDELVAQRNYFTGIMDRVPVDIATFDTEYRYTYINKTAVKDEHMRQWIIGKTDADYAEFRKIDTSFIAPRREMLKNALHTKEPAYLEETMITPAGTKKYTIKGAAPILSDNTEPVGIVAFSIDITDRKNAEDKLKEAMQDLERVNDGLKQFAYVTSHDLKTPLRNIATYLQLLKRNNQLDDHSNEMIESAVNSVKSMNQLLNDVFHYATTDFKNKVAEKTDLRDVIKAIKNDTGALLIERKAELIVDENLPHVFVNRTQAVHLFSNLVSNALKYNNHPQPRIEIKTGKVNGYAEFSVKDNGIGIQPEYHEKIFEIFKRLHTQSEYEGTGMGLAICKKIVESYGGKIKVESTPGAGSEFVFTLPAEEQSNGS